jgi:hypothetical protein
MAFSISSISATTLQYILYAVTAIVCVLIIVLIIMVSKGKKQKVNDTKIRERLLMNTLSHEAELAELERNTGVIKPQAVPVAPEGYEVVEIDETLITRDLFIKTLIKTLDSRKIILYDRMNELDKSEVLDLKYIQGAIEEDEQLVTLLGNKLINKTKSVKLPKMKFFEEEDEPSGFKE